MKQLSPKKYIETKVRSLPIYKCLVNQDWREAGLANVIIMRQHVNGNVSGGIYLVDLKCLGIKDTMWFFNEYEEDMIEKFFSGDVPFQTIDYTLAHNIVYAGHDFAMEFDIHPEKEFAISRFVLEEDTDDIPLIEIETGENGMPHLIVHEAGQYTDALARLRKNAGEGNYHYTILVDGKDDFDDEDDFDDDDEMSELRLSEIADGDLDLRNISEVQIDDLLDENAIGSRNDLEKILCKAELLIRSFNLIHETDADETVEIDEEWEMLPGASTYDTGMNEDSYQIAMEQMADASEELMVFGSESPERYPIKQKYLALNQHNPLFICLMLEYELMSRNENAHTLLQQYIQPLRSVPIIQLLLALESILMIDDTEEWQPIIQARHATDAMPQLPEWGGTELLYFWTIQIIRHVQEGKLAEAIAYYDVFTAIDDALLHLPLVMIIYDILLPPLEQAIEKDIKRITPTEEESNND